jgi:hypothetical protein
MPVLLTAFAAFALGGCYREYVVRDPLTAQEVIELTRQGKTPEEIRRRIDESGTVYLLDTDDILSLSKEGVDPQVIEHMRETRERDLERRAAYRDYYYYYPHYPPPGHLYFHAWPYGFGYGLGWRSHYWW